MRTLPDGALATAVLLTLVLATGCSGEPASDAAAPTGTSRSATGPTGPTGPTEPPLTGVPAYATYVALGDSYTAAPLVPQTDTTNGCLRSTGNYPSLVAAAMPGTTLVDVSCSGADTTSMIGAQVTGSQSQPPQFDALDTDTELVTVGIGGNDFNLFGTLIGVCAQLRDSDPEGAPCRTQLEADEPGRLARDLADIRSRVTAVVRGIRDRAPDARVVVVGYPQILPGSGSCPALLPLATGDVAFGREINEGLARAVARGARAAGAEYVDVFAASKGHDICSADPWVNGQVTDPGRALAYHPFDVEQRAVADLLLARLTG